MSCVHCFLVHGCETWAVNVNDMRRLEGAADKTMNEWM